MRMPTALSRGIPDLRRLAGVTAGLVGTQAVTSALGFGYWVLAAREFAVSAVGVAGAATSAMQLLGTVGMLGLGTLLISRMHTVAPAQRRQLVRTALLMSGAASLGLGLVFSVVVGRLEPGGLGQVGSSPLIIVLFAVGVMTSGATMVLDQAVLAIGTGLLQLERNAVASAVKIVALAALALAGASGGMTIYASWVIGTCASLPLLMWRTRGGLALQESRRLVDLRRLRSLGRSAASHHLLNLVLQAPLMLLPVVLTLVDSTTAAGYFSTALLMSGFVFVLPFAISIALFASADGDPRQVARRARLTIPFGLSVSIAADVVIYFAAPLLLHAFGGAYSGHAVSTLRLLVLAGLPLVIKDHYVALRRVQDRPAKAALVLLAGSLGELLGAAVGGTLGGADGLSLGFVIALAVEACVLVTPLMRSVRELGSDVPDDEGPDLHLDEPALVGLPFPEPIQEPAVVTLGDSVLQHPRQSAASSPWSRDGHD